MSFFVIQSVTIKHIYLTPYICNEQISDGLQFTLNELFFNKTLIKFIAHSVRLLFGAFCVNYSSHTEHVKGPRKFVSLIDFASKTSK